MYIKLNVILDDKTTHNLTEFLLSSNIWSPTQTDWRKAVNNDTTTLLAHKVTQHKLSSDKTAPIETAQTTSSILAKPSPMAFDNPTKIDLTQTMLSKSPLDLFSAVPADASEIEEPVESTDCTKFLDTAAQVPIKCKRAALGNQPFAPVPFALPPFPDLQSETSAERAVRMQKDIQKLMHFITVVGHVDSFFSKRFRSGVKKFARLYDSDEVVRPKIRRRRRPLY